VTGSMVVGNVSPINPAMRSMGTEAPIDLSRAI
jgi:hypothetical protein